MNWLALLTGLIKLTLWLIDYLEKQEVISEAEARVIRKLQEDTDARLKAVAAARANPDDDSLRDDGHRRD